MVNYKIIVEKVRQMRMKHEKTQQEFAEDLFIHTKHYAKIERGKVKPTLELLKKLSDVYGVDLAHFFEHSSPANKQESIEEITSILSKCSLNDLQKIFKMIKIIIT